MVSPPPLKFWTPLKVDQWPCMVPPKTDGLSACFSLSLEAFFCPDDLLGQRPEGYIKGYLHPIYPVSKNHQKGYFKPGYFGDLGSNHVDVSAVSKLE
jgi:hypothetical protein